MKFGVDILMQPLDNNKILKFELTVSEISTILNALQEVAAKICNPLTLKIQQQAQSQLDEGNTDANA